MNNQEILNKLAEEGFTLNDLVNAYSHRCSGTLSTAEIFNNIDSYRKYLGNKTPTETEKEATVSTLTIAEKLARLKEEQQRPD